MRKLAVGALTGLLALVVLPGEAPASFDAATAAHAPPCHRTLRGGGDLQHFVNVLRPGQTGCLAGGEYRISDFFAIRRSGRRDARITLTSADPTRPALVRGRFWVADSANWWTFTRLRFDGRNGKSLPSPTVNGDATVWRHVSVTNHRAGHAADNGAGICFLLGSTHGYGIAHDTLIERSRIHDCGVSSNHNHGIYVEATRGRTIIRDNVIVRAGDRGIQLYPDGDDVLIEHNVLLGNGSGVIFSGTNGTASDRVTLRRNVIAGSVVRWNVESYYGGELAGQDNVVTQNCLWATNPHKDGYYRQRGGVADEVGFRTAGNRVSPPVFVRPGRGDYRVRPGSLCDGTGPRFAGVGARR